MCLAGCNKSSPPSGSVASAAVATTCPTSSSQIQLIDEIGLPFANQAVTVTLPDGRAGNGNTLADGRLCLSAPPGTSVRIQLANTHEGQPSESTTTPSGRHFLMNGIGP